MGEWQMALNDRIKKIGIYAAIFIAGSIFWPAVFFAWAYIDTKLTEREQCAGIDRAGALHIAMEAYKYRASHDDRPDDWYGIDLLDPSTYRLEPQGDSQNNAVKFSNRHGDQVTAIVYEDCVTTWTSSSVLDVRRANGESVPIPTEFAKPQSAPAPQPAPHR